MTEDVAAQIEAGVKLLLETKHLYQSVTIELGTVTGSLKMMMASAFQYGSQNSIALQYKAELASIWVPTDQAPCSVNEERQIDRTLIFTLPTVTLYCATCERSQPYNPVSRSQHDTISCFDSPAVQELLSRNPLSNHELGKPPPVTQTFALSFQCQGCKGRPEVFLVHRSGFKLTLCGRQPIETVEVPKFIPRQQSKYFSDAIVAHQSGQTLSGLFQFRTFIEQFCLARSSDKNLPADRLVDAYTKTLPDDFKKRFPSLGKLYSDLSVAIHSASEDTALFDAARDDLVKHFDARRMYEL